jgi:hypothetical protein
MISINTLLLAISSFGMSACLAYALWSKVRVIFLREELFEIRDDLWDAARRHGGFDDPAYLEARTHLNAAIVAGPLCSVSILQGVVRRVKREDIEAAISQKSQNHEFQNAIDLAYRRTISKCVAYIYLWRASGWLHVINFRTRAVRLQFMRWLKSNEPAELAEYERCSQPPTATAH